MRAARGGVAVVVAEQRIDRRADAADRVRGVNAAPGAFPPAEVFRQGADIRRGGPRAVHVVGRLLPTQRGHEQGAGNPDGLEQAQDYGLGRVPQIPQGAEGGVHQHRVSALHAESVQIRGNSRYRVLIMHGEVSPVVQADSDPSGGPASSLRALSTASVCSFGASTWPQPLAPW